MHTRFHRLFGEDKYAASYLCRVTDLVLCDNQKSEGSRRKCALLLSYNTTLWAITAWKKRGCLISRVLCHDTISFPKEFRLPANSSSCAVRQMLSNCDEIKSPKFDAISDDFRIHLPIIHRARAVTRPPRIWTLSWAQCIRILRKVSQKPLGESSRIEGKPEVSWLFIVGAVTRKSRPIVDCDSPSPYCRRYRRCGHSARVVERLLKVRPSLFSRSQSKSKSHPPSSTI